MPNVITNTSPLHKIPVLGCVSRSAQPTLLLAADGVGGGEWRPTGAVSLRHSSGSCGGGDVWRRGAIGFYGHWPIGEYCGPPPGGRPTEYDFSFGGSGRLC